MANTGIVIKRRKPLSKDVVLKVTVDLTGEYWLRLRLGLFGCKIEIK